jgi:hypothetical protein
MYDVGKVLLNLASWKDQNNQTISGLPDGIFT